MRSNEDIESILKLRESKPVRLESHVNGRGEDSKENAGRASTLKRDKGEDFGAAGQTR